MLFVSFLDLKDHIEMSFMFRTSQMGKSLLLYMHDIITSFILSHSLGYYDPPYDVGNGLCIQNLGEYKRV